MANKIMVVDDSRAILRTLEKHLGESGYEVLTAGDGITALDLFQQSRPDAVILDIRMPGIDGLEALKRIKEIDQDIPVIMVTALEDMQTTIRAVQLGAYEYINKPIDLDKLEVVIAHAIESRKLKEQVTRIVNGHREEFRIDNIIGKNNEIKEIFKIIGSVTDTRATVLITGESGTGKELVAKAIHYSSQWASQPFVPVNCTALTETLLNSELFGHVKGSFTGAIADKKGKFEVAGEGTLFLDEVGEMSPQLQVKLLRVLQEKEFERVGGNVTIKCGARVIAATNSDLAKKVENSDFREDLYYRMKVVEIRIPPLRNRKDDIPILVEYLLEKIGRELHKMPKIMPTEVMKKLTAYNWPGNIRELENMLMRAMVLAKGDVIGPELFHIPEESETFQKTAAASRKENLAMTLAEIEKEHIEKVIAAQNWNKKRTIEILGISRPTLDKKIREYEIKRGSE